MSIKNLDFNKLDEELMEIYNSQRRPNRAIEKKLKEVIESVED